VRPGGARERETAMSSTHLSLHVHLVFGTKHQRPLIVPAWRERLHAYLGGVARALGTIPEAVGGVADHAHLLVGLRAIHRLADLLRDLKRESSSWVHETIGEPEFGWQDGYGAFTVSASLVETVKRYIARQEEHHQKKTFQEEYVELLRRSGVEYDEKYLW
jgi:putative transposase